MNTLDLFRLDGKVAIVTGANGLLGQRHCKALAEAGAIVVAADVGGATGAHAAENVDVTSKESVLALRERVLEAYGRIDVLVNNAAVNDMVENPVSAAEESMFENYPLDLFRRVMDVNVTGTFLCCQVLGAQMAAQRSGSIINIASTYGVTAPDQNIYKLPDGSQPFFKSAAYPTSKGAVVMLTRFLATYWGEKGVRVNTLSPGGVENNQPEHFISNYSRRTPLGRMATPTDYMGALVFLASDASAYMTGHNLLVDGGWTIW